MDNTREKLIDVNLANADSSTTTNKIKTHFAEIVVEVTFEKPYYGILYFNPTDKEYHIGFGSYCLSTVFQWLSQEFDVDYKYFATDNNVGDKWIPVAERLPKPYNYVLVYGGGGVSFGYMPTNIEWKGVSHWMPLPEPPKGD